MTNPGYRCAGTADRHSDRRVAGICPRPL